MSMIDLEICVDTIAGVAAARAGGASRVELCAGLGVGGLLPARAVVAAAVAEDMPVCVLVRLAEGGFVVDAAMVEHVATEIRALEGLGVSGVVVGALTLEGALDVAALRRWRDAAGGMAMTLHRAIDLCADPIAAVDRAVEIGVDRILTSGQRRRAIDGVAVIRAMARRAAGRVAIVAGAGIVPDHVAPLHDAGAAAIHASASVPVPAEDPRLAEFGFVGAGRRSTCQDTVAALRAAIDRSRSAKRHG